MIRRPLMQKEIDELEKQGNACDKWVNIRVAQDFTVKNIRNSRFSGKIKLHGFSGKKISHCGVEFETGIYDSWINESVVEDACVCGVKMLSNSVVCDGALVFNAGSVFCDKDMSSIRIGSEMGARVLKRQFSENERTVIGRNSVVSNVQTLGNAHIGENARIENGAVVLDSIVENNAVVTENAIVKSSFISSFSHVGEAEVTSSLVGPLTQIHHHSLLISALWAEGRGNIGYGANVGSNHTGRMPDQEIIPGLGQFFGLGCNVKFPSNFAEAPFTIIATGVTTEPQRLKFPFSLIKNGSLGGLNEIVPAWVYAKNAYGVFRNVYKWDLRCGRDDSLGFLFSLDVRNAVKYACGALSDYLKNKRNGSDDAVEYGNGEFLVEQSILGLGSNYMLAENIELAIEGYEIYAEDCEHYLKTKKLSKGVLKRVEYSLERDYKRGREIFDDYESFHPLDDKFFDWLKNLARG